MLARQYFIYVTLLLIACISSWFLLQALEQLPIKQNANNRPDAFMINAVGTRMDQQGLLQDQIVSPKLVHFSTGDITNITTPHFIIFNTSGEPLHVTSNYGQARNGIDILELWGNVKLHQAAGPKNSESTLTTTSVTIYPKQQCAETAQPVKVWQLGSVVTSVGMRANLKTGEIDLLSQAHGIYQPNTSKK